MPSERQRAGARAPAYIGEEVKPVTGGRTAWAVSRGIAPTVGDGLVTNRDLPILLPVGTDARGGLRHGSSNLPVVSGVDAMTVRPSLCRANRWAPKLAGISSASSASTIWHWPVKIPEQAAAGIRAMLRLYGPVDDVAWARQVDGLRSLAVQSIVRRLPASKGPLSFGNGLSIEIELDELAFRGHQRLHDGHGAGALPRQARGHQQLHRPPLRSSQRGFVFRWANRMGGRERL